MELHFHYFFFPCDSDTNSEMADFGGQIIINWDFLFDDTVDGMHACVASDVLKRLVADAD